MKISCLLVSGAYLNDEISNFLQNTAFDMIKCKDRKRRFELKSEGLRGHMTTHYQVGFIGAMSGIAFKAEFEWSNGETIADFIVRPPVTNEELERAQWRRIPLFDEDEEAIQKRN